MMNLAAVVLVVTLALVLVLALVQRAGDQNQPATLFYAVQNCLGHS